MGSKKKKLLKEKALLEWIARSKYSKLHTIRHNLYLTIEGNGTSGVAILMVVCAAIFTSIVVIIMQSMREYDDVPESTWNTLETLCVMIFSAEIIVRAFCTPDMKKEVKDILNWVDLLATLPWYIEQSGVGGNMDVWRVLRALRVVRLLKLFRHDEGIGVLLKTLSTSSSAIIMFLGVVASNMIFFSLAVFEFERGDYDADLGYYVINGRKSEFQSVVSGFYWVVATISTVGYGDIYPLTTGGKLVGGVCCVLGTVSIMLPLTIIGVNFCAAYDSHRLEKEGEEGLESLENTTENDVIFQLSEDLARIKKEIEDDFGMVLMDSHMNGSSIILKTMVHEKLDSLGVQSGVHGEGGAMQQNKAAQNADSDTDEGES